MNQQRYWRNLIADQIKAEHDRVKKYYMKKGMNSGGMSTEEQTRLNIFMLCDSIVRTVTDAPDAPVKKSTVDLPESTPKSIPEPIVEPVEESPIPIEDDFDKVNDFIEEQTMALWEDEEKKENNQNQFGEFL